MYLFNKLFERKDIRMVWNKDEEKYYVSVVDIVGVLTNSENPRKYWNKLKLKAKDGKYYLTDATDIEGILRIIESIPGKKAEPIKMWC